LTFTKFIKIIGGASLGCILLFFLLSLILNIGQFFDFLLLSILFFSALSILTYWLGNAASKGKDGSVFIRIVIMNVFTKLIGSFLFVMAYVKIKEPSGRLFLIPFLLTYLLFLICETYFLNIQARNSHKRNS